MKVRRLMPLAIAATTLTSSMGLVAAMESTAHASGTVHLTYTLWDPNEEVGYKKSIAVFEQSHPGVTVSIQQIPYSAYQTKLQEEFASGSGPDLFWINTPWLSTWIKDGFLVNLAPDIKKANINLKQYIPSLVALHEYKGAIYGFPKDWDTIGIYYNENYMKAHHLTPPSNWTWNPTNGGTFLKFLEAGHYRHQRQQRHVAELQPEQGSHLRDGDGQRLPDRFRQFLADERLSRHTGGLGLVDQLQHPGLRPDDPVRQRPDVQVPRPGAGIGAGFQRREPERPGQLAVRVGQNRHGVGG